uniref:ShKT domain-containing protein n=1 Tax=Meloidogyne javanica TaxID=6303 RepID=A0A915N8X1_MELJA
MKENGEYDRFAKQHRRVVVEGGAHSGPAFLLWHREFLKRFETTVRLYDPSISLPYWDSVLDSRIPKSADSYLFSNELFGETDNNQSVINGPYSPWKTLEGNQFITRSVGESGSCLKQADIDTIMNKNGILNCLGYSTPKEECASDDHYANATMEPFNNLVNIDALRNVYTDLLYEYAPRPNCDNITDCGSKYLFCDRSHGKPECVAKIKIGGNCTGFEIPNLAANFAAVPATPYQCRDLGCLCRFMGGCPNGPLQRAVRTEYRLMTEDQRQRYHNALLQMKSNGLFDQIASVHTTAVQTGSAHGGPAFHPWHREYLKRYEFALRMVDPSIALPYWDSTLDGALPTPADSILFSQELMGQADSNGQLRSGRFAPWRTLEGNPFITRFVGSGGACYQESQIQWVWGQRDIALMLAYSFPNAVGGCPFQLIWNLPEVLTHGNVHIFVGGDMLDPRTSANDPLFYMHHSFVDYIWEGYRVRQQSRQQRETEYPADNLQCEPAQHFAGTPMLPFNPMNNIDGLSNAYTDNLYQFAERPTCRSGANCGSPYLFCDRSHGAPRCASKVRIGGDCRGFNFQEDVCFNGFCSNGRCVGRQLRADEDGEEDSEVNETGVQNDPAGQIPDQVAFACYNEHECCAIWAYEGECENNSAYMDIMCRASCGKTENCRKTCNRCREPRAWACTKTRGRSAKSSFVSGGQCAKKTCYNENQCCQQWSRNGVCTDSPD